MKHFGEARRDAATVAQDPMLLQRCERLCLLWDVRGRLRLLVKPASGNDANQLGADLAARMQAAADHFWSGETWIWLDSSTPAEKQLYEQAWRQAEPLPKEAEDSARSRMLDRHLSKQTWFGEPRKPPWLLLEQTAPVLSFFSFKGGVGRTTALVSVALQLARAGRRVCVIDLDLEAPGVGTLLASAQGTAAYGVLDFLLEGSVIAPDKLDLGDFLHVYEDAQAIGNGPPIEVVPAGKLDEDYLEKLARIDYQALLSPTSDESALHALLRRLRKERAFDYVLMDSRAGLHDIGGLALNGIAHLDVIFALDSEQSWQGLPIIIDHLGRRRVLRGLQQQDCVLVYAMAPPATSPERQERVERFRARAYDDLFVNLFYDAEPQGGWPTPRPEDVWPVPPMDDEDEPHYALPVGVKFELQVPWTPATAASLLVEGDYRDFFSSLLQRLGRTEP